MVIEMEMDSEMVIRTIRGSRDFGGKTYGYVKTFIK